MTAITASFHMIYEPNAAADAITQFILLFHLDAYRKLLPLFAALPFAAQFSKEWNSHSFDSILYRSGLRSYVRTQICVCVISSFIVCFVGLMLFIGYTCILKPIDLGRYFLPVPPYDFWQTNGMPLGYMITVASIFSMSCSLWSVCGLTMSAVFPNIYVAIATPFICSYLVERITYHCSPYLRFDSMAIGVQVLDSESGIANYLYTICFYLFWIVTLGLVFGGVIEKRMKNELH